MTSVELTAELVFYMMNDERVVLEVDENVIDLEILWPISV